MACRPHVLFFLGAGVSKPSGLPLAAEMDSFVFGDDVEWHGPGAMRFGEPRKVDDGGKGRRVACEVRSFLRVLQRVVQEAFNEQAEGPTGHEPHQVGYEDLFFACEQIRSSEMGYGRDPAAPLLAERIRREARNHLLKAPGAEDGVQMYVPYRPRKHTDLAYTSLLSMALIASVVQDRLAVSAEPKGLGAVLDAVRSGDVDRVTVITLNHDRMVEELFEGAGLLAGKPGGFEDGFGPPVAESDLRPYEPGRLSGTGTKLQVVKPHGSINWYLVEQKTSGITPEPPEGASRFASGYAAATGPPPYKPFQRSVSWPKDRPAHKCERPAKLIQYVPSLLTSYGKDREYGSDIFGDMMSVSLRALEEADAVFVSGFGWNDPGMRNRLLGALRRSKKKRMFLLHRQTNEEKANGQIAGGLDLMTADPFAEREQLHCFNDWLCDFTWEELWAKSRAHLPR